jgi:2,5-furandicarboxylate decarboxylase 1
MATTKLPEPGRAFEARRLPASRRAPGTRGAPDSPRQDWRTFIGEVEEAGEVRRVTSPVSREYEISTLMMDLEARQEYPLVIFENVEDSEHPVVTNLLAPRGRMARAMRHEERDLAREFSRRIARPPGVELLAERPCEECTLEGEAVDLSRFPILTHFPIDAGPYVTAGLAVARDPHSGAETLGFHRMQLKGKNKLGISLHSRQRLWEYLRRSEERGHDLEAAVVIGVHPLIALGSMALVPYEEGKYGPISGLFGEPLQVTPCSSVELAVPAWAEIVLEGRILAGVRENEGPFAEFTNYACFRSTENVFQVERVRYRPGAHYHGLTPGMSSEHITIVGIQREGDVMGALDRALPNVKAVHAPFSACGLFHCYVSLSKVAEGQAQQAVFAAFGVDHNLKLVVVVDDDVDVYDERQVLWALATRLQADRGVTIVPQHLGMGCTLDPSADELSRSAKMGIDATRPLSGFAPTIEIDDKVRGAVRRLWSEVGLQS